MKPSPDEVNQHFTNHKEALRSVKPVVESFRKSDLRVSRNNKKELLNYNDFDLVYKTFKSINNQKCTVDNKRPDTGNIKKYKIFKDKYKKNRLDQFQASEHQRELNSIKLRIQNCGNIAQRKKRNYDPITHPTYLMRKPSEGTNEITIEPFAQTVLKSNQPKVTRPSSAGNYQKMTATANSHFNAVKQKLSQQQDSEPNENHVKQQHGEAPSAKMSKTNNNRRPQSAKEIAKVDHPFPECNFKSILNYIIDRRLYKNLDLKVLYERLCYRYGEAEIDPIWYQVKEQLEQ